MDLIVPSVGKLLSDKSKFSKVHICSNRRLNRTIIEILCNFHILTYFQNLPITGKPLKKRGPHKQEVIDLIFYIYVPKATGLTNTRQSTWMNPIINGVEARKLMGNLHFFRSLVRLSNNAFADGIKLDSVHLFICVCTLSFQAGI